MGIRKTHLFTVLFMLLGVIPIFAQNEAKESFLSKYEYWIDNDSKNKQAVNYSDSIVKLEVDCSSLSPGVHTLNFRGMNPDGEYGILHQQQFYVYRSYEPDAKYARYEYWYDNDYTNKTVVAKPETEITLALDISGKANGLHVFNIRTQNDQGFYGSLSQALFYVIRNDNEKECKSEYEYWIDNPVNIQRTISADDVTTLSISMDTLAVGVHRFFYRSKGTNGIWGNLYQAMFVRTNAAEIEGSPIVGYRYNFGGTSIEESFSPRSSYQMNNYSIDLPNLKDVGSLTKGCSFSFDIENVKLTRSQTVTFNIQFKNEVGDWSNPTCYDFEMSDKVVHEYSSLSIEQKAILERTSKGDFHAVKCIVDETRNYFLKSSSRCNIDVYKSDGSLLTHITPDDLKRAYQIGLNKGTYYFIVYNMEDDATLRLLTNEDYVDTPVITHENETLEISCSQEGAVIYYTIDGTEPSETSIVYNSPTLLKRNCTVKAIAMHEGMSPSDVATYVIDGFKVDTPTIDFVNSEFVLATKTEGAAIHYTLDGTPPNSSSTKYIEPLILEASCVIKAIGVLDGYYDSEIASYEFNADGVRCATPQIKLEGNTLVVNCSTEEAVLHYTTDGTKPTAEAAVYTMPIEIKHNMVVNVVAMKDNWLNSAMATYTVDWYKVATPKFVYDNGMLSINVDTPNAIIHYTKDGKTPTESSEIYTKPIEVIDNSTIKAVGFLEHYNSSDVATYSVNSFVCNPASIAYKGRYATLETSTDKSEIYYTIDGSKPTKSSRKYTGSFDVKGLTTVRAIVVKPNYNDSEEASYVVSYYYDGETVSLGESGNIAKAFEWCGTDGITSLSVNGKIDGGDISYVTSLQNIRHLTLEDADVVGNSIASNTFANSKLVSVSLPKTLSSIGANIFAGCSNLAAIVWNANISLPSNALAGLSNPNLLLYVRLNSYAPSSVKNVIVNDYAENIVLTDGAGNINFYCPRPFTAKSISYRHNFSMKTQIGTCQGWETIALPFDVQTITHSKNGEIAPFAANNAMAKPFWMYSLGDYGFEMADKIKANIPYIISMPNNEEYADEYILGGDVTFSAENVKVPVTEQKALSKGEFLFIPTTVKVAQNSNVYAINKNEEYNGQLPGSMFVPGLRSVSPFEGYLALASEVNRPAMVRLRDIGFDDDISGIVNLKKQSGLQIWGATGSIHIRTDREKTVNVYSISGSLVQTVDLNVGENVINGIDAGVYIVEHTPVFVK